jgi:ubiquinone/menaquinone biosynthesis C-methylase UbiE
MKISNPKSRNHLKVPTKYSVLEVGGGHNPHKRSNVIVDKFIDSNYHRSGDVKVYSNQKFVQADGEKLPFKDNEFDYVICNQVLEHVDNPEQFLKEQARVAKKGYIEVPSLIGEYLHPKESHKWLILEMDSKLILMDKNKVGFKPSHDLGDVFLHYMPKHSLGYKIMQYTHGNIHTIRYEWKDSIDVIVNPTEEKYLKYFQEKWEINEIENFLPNRSLTYELWSSICAFSFILKSVIKSKLFANQA